MKAKTEITQQQIDHGNELLNAFMYGEFHYASSCENVEFESDWNLLHEVYAKLIPILGDGRRKNYASNLNTLLRIERRFTSNNKEGAFIMMVDAIKSLTK